MPETDAVSTIEPGFLRAHDGHRGADAVDGSEEVDPKRALPDLGLEIVDPAVWREDSGVADDHVEAAEALDGQRHHRLDLGDLADVRDLRFDPPVRFGKAGQRRLE